MPKKGQPASAEQRAATAARNRLIKRKYPVGYAVGSRLYRIWRGMYLRCYQPSHRAHARYSAKRIEICQEWLTYAPFMEWALANGYSEDLQIDREKNDQGYNPQNCRWVTHSTQQRNTDSNLAPIEAFGEMKTPIEWSEDPRCKVPYHLLWRRLAAGWPAETSIVTPSQHRKKRTVGYALGGLRPKGSTVPRDQQYFREWKD
jgi:hypothetical protein